MRTAARDAVVGQARAVDKCPGITHGAIAIRIPGGAVEQPKTSLVHRFGRAGRSSWLVIIEDAPSSMWPDIANLADFRPDVSVTRVATSTSWAGSDPDAACAR